MAVAPARAVGLGEARRVALVIYPFPRALARTRGRTSRRPPRCRRARPPRLRSTPRECASANARPSSGSARAGRRDPGRSSGPGPACPPAPAGTPPAGGGAPAPSPLSTRRCAGMPSPAPHPGSGRAPALQRGGAAMDAVIDRLTAGVDPRPHLDARLQPRNRARNSRSCATDSRSTPAHSRLNLARSIPFPHGTPWRCSCNVLIEMWDNQHESQTSPNLFRCP